MSLLPPKGSFLRGVFSNIQSTQLFNEAKKSGRSKKGTETVNENKSKNKGKNRSINKNKNKRTRRGRKKFNKTLNIFSTNANGLNEKENSLKSELKYFNASIFCIQETHYTTKGKLKIENYNIFESIRDKEKGGTLLGVHCSLNPKLISEHSTDFELLVVETDIAGKKVRIMTSYGSQESWKEEDRKRFFKIS